MPGVWTGGPGSPPAGDPAQPGPSQEPVHDWLNRRIAEVKSERAGRWQKILSAFGGGAAPPG
jgi:hypothetical protein